MNTKQTNCVIICITLLLAGCNIANPAIGREFLEAIHRNDLRGADQYVCTDKQGTLVESIVKENMMPRGTHILGVKSPGITDINCKNKDGKVLCTFNRPKLLCTGDLLGGGAVTCTSFDPNGEPTELTLDMEDGKICGYELRSP
jgi:hypothetical protein